MTIKDFEDQIDFLHKALLKKYKKTGNEPELKYLQMVKIQEELGELAQEILKTDQLQRVEKGEHDIDNLKEELGDTIFGLLYLAKTLGLSLEEVLTSRLEKDSSFINHKS